MNRRVRKGAELARQRGWWRNPFPSHLRLFDRLVTHAVRMLGERQPRKALFETLEPRMLLSADPLQGAADAAAASVLTQNDAGGLTAPYDEPAICLALGQGAAAAAHGSTSAGGAVMPSVAELAALLTEAVARMGYESAPRIELTDLEGPYLAQTDGNRIRLDVDATGYGWFFDATPSDD